MSKNGLAIFRTISGGGEVPRSAFRQPFTRRPAAMPRSDPLSCLEAEVSRLTGALALRERDIARLMSRLKSSEAQIWVLRRRNSVLALSLIHISEPTRPY